MSDVHTTERTRGSSRGGAGDAERINAYYLELGMLLDRIEHAASHYQVLGLRRSATRAEMQMAYRQAVSLLHPSQYGIDLSLPDEMVTRNKRAFNGVSLAFSVLTNAGRRIEYDNSLRAKAKGALPTVISQPSREIGTDAATETYERDQEQDREVIVVDHRQPQRKAFSKPAESAKREDRRRCPRFRLPIPAYVTIYDRDGSKVREIAQVADVGRFGVGIRLTQRVKPGRVVHLSLPMPSGLRNHQHSNFSYDVYAIVRRVEQPQNGASLTGVEFIGERPPAGFLEKPWAIFELKLK